MLQNLISYTTFILSIIILLCTPSYLPNFHPIFFAPYLIFNFYRFSKENIVLKSIFLGILCDLLSSFVFGIHSILYFLTTILLYKTHRIFLKDKLLSIPIMTFLYSGIFHLISYFIIPFFNYPFFFDKFVFKRILVTIIKFDFPYVLCIYVIPCIIIKTVYQLYFLIRRLA